MISPRVIGRGIAAVGSLLLFLSLFLSYRSGGLRGWETFDKIDIALALLAGSCLIVVVLSHFLAAISNWLSLGAACLAAASLGFFALFTAEIGGGFGIGWYLGMFAAGAVVTGALLAFVAPAAERNPSTVSPETFGASVDTAAQAELTPPGWYPDPAGTGRSRWWNGQAWGEETR